MEAFILWATFESTFPKKEASTRGTDGHPTFCPTIFVILRQKVRHRLPSWLQHRLQWLPSQRPLHRCHGKVTGATQKWVSAVNHIRQGLVSVCSVEKRQHARFRFEIVCTNGAPRVTRPCSNEPLFSLEYPQESVNFVYR